VKLEASAAEITIGSSELPEKMPVMKDNLIIIIIIIITIIIIINTRLDLRDRANFLLLTKPNPTDNLGYMKVSLQIDAENCN
jgi:hypothetical protein